MALAAGGFYTGVDRVPCSQIPAPAMRAVGVTLWSVERTLDKAFCCSRTLAIIFWVKPHCIERSVTMACSGRLSSLCASHKARLFSQLWEKCLTIYLPAYPSSPVNALCIIFHSISCEWWVWKNTKHLLTTATLQNILLFTRWLHAQFQTNSIKQHKYKNYNKRLIFISSRHPNECSSRQIAVADVSFTHTHLLQNYVSC